MILAAQNQSSHMHRFDPSALPDVWRASELARSTTPTCSTGHVRLDGELPNGGWPRSTLVELLPQQAGIGEMQLLKPALVALSKTQRIALVQPPYIPQVMACRAWGIDINRLIWIRAKTTADALWTTEQILKNGSCGAVILWQTNVRNESLRRLNLAAQSTDTWFWFVRPLVSASDASPASLRVALKPAVAGISLEIIKRRGHQTDGPLFLPLTDIPVGKQQASLKNETVTLHTPTVATPRVIAPILV